jgi:hypothetical protein
MKFSETGNLLCELVDIHISIDCDAQYQIAEKPVARFKGYIVKIAYFRM